MFDKPNVPDTDAGTYEVGKLLGETERFRLFECRLPDGTVCILKLANTINNNGDLDREAYVLENMRREAGQLETEYVKHKTRADDYLNYQLCFPDLVDSFIPPEKEGRRVNIVRFLNVADDLSRLVPISRLITQACLRVDPMTSVWITGKLLKALAFAHNQGIAVGQVNGDNILIEPDQHYVIIFDWSLADSHYGVSEVPPQIAAGEISLAGAEMIRILGGDPESGEIPEHEQLKDSRYAEFLTRLAHGKARDAHEAHDAFYKLARSLWPRRFHPFTTLPL